MKILYNKRQQTFLLLWGIVWLVLGSVSYIIEPSRFISLGLIMGIAYICIYGFRKTFHYAVLDENSIKKVGLTKQIINLDDVVSVRKFAGDYIIKTKARTMTLNTNLIDKQSLPELKRFFDILDKY